MILFHQIFILWFTRKKYRSSHQYPIAMKKSTKPILWEEPGKLVPILFPKYGCSFQSDFYCMIYFITWKLNRTFHQYPIATENEAKHILWGEPGKLLSKLFPKYGWFSSIIVDSLPILWYALSHENCMTFSLNFS